MVEQIAQIKFKVCLSEEKCDEEATRFYID